MIEILSGGVLSTVQDQGRYGYRQYGVPISGAMDLYALRLANILVGNNEEAAGIEVTFYGLKLRSTEDTWVAITGGDLSPQKNGKPVPMWRSICLKKNEILSFRGLRSGFRAYMAVHGGIDIPLLMNSRSTSIKAAFGGTGGALKTGDRLKTWDSFAGGKMQEKLIPDQFIPLYSTQNELRVVLGPQADYFPSEIRELFLNSEYTITPQSDRQGYRLTGPALKHIRSYDVITEAVWPGRCRSQEMAFPSFCFRMPRPLEAIPKSPRLFRWISISWDRQSLRTKFGLNRLLWKNRCIFCASKRSG